MATYGSTFTQYDAIGNREDLSDVIYNVDPTETPFASNISRVSATHVKHEWQTDAFAAVDTANAQLEGDNVTAGARNATTRLDNQCQIMWKVISVSGTQRSMNPAGRDDEFGYQVVKAGAELKRDIERIVLSEHGKVTGSTATARQLGGLETWLSSNKSSFASTATTPGGGTALVDATNITVTVAQLKTAIDSVILECFEAGGDPKWLMAKPAVKAILSNMTGIATLYRDVPAMTQGQIIGGADVYVSNFGNHYLIPNRFMRSQTIFAVDPEYFALAELRTMRVEDLAKTGDNDRRMILTELTLESRNEKSSGKVADFVAI